MATGTVRVRRGFFGPVGWERVSWSGVIAGLVMAVATQMLLSMLGMAIGLTTLVPEDGASAQAIGWGAAIWALLSIAISLGVGGYVAGRFAASTTGASGAMNGALVWGLAFILMGYLMVSGFGALVGGAFGAAGRLAQAAPIEQERAERLEQMAREAGIDVERLQRELSEAVGTAGREDAAEAAQQAAGYSAAAAWLLFLGSLLGLFVAAWAGARGHRAGMPLVEPPPAA